MAVEDKESEDLRSWSNVTQFWYNKAVDKSPNCGRLHHHLAMFFRAYSLEQLSFYTRSLICVDAYKIAPCSLTTLFNHVLYVAGSRQSRFSSFEIRFIQAHGFLFTGDPLRPDGNFDAVIEELQKDYLFDNYIHDIATKFRENGVHVATVNIAALFEYGTCEHGAMKPILRTAFEKARVVEMESCGIAFPDSNEQKRPLPPKVNVQMPRPPPSEAAIFIIAQASRLGFFTLSVALKRPQDANVYPLVHMYLAFLRSLVNVDEIWGIIEKDVPWGEMCSFLNILVSEFELLHSKNQERAQSRLRSKEIPNREQGTFDGGPLPEDYILRGQLYSSWLYPATWFIDPMDDDDDRYIKMPLMDVTRLERILWLGHGIASVRKTAKSPKSADLPVGWTMDMY